MLVAWGVFNTRGKQLNLGGFDESRRASLSTSCSACKSSWCRQEGEVLFG